MYNYYERGVMMATRIIKAFEETHPALRFIGKKYTNKDRVNGSYAAKWQEWFKEGYFKPLDLLGETTQVDNGYLGFMKANLKHFDETFEYWIGAFFDPYAVVPKGYEYFDLPESKVGICYIQGKESEGLYQMHDDCVDTLLKHHILKQNNIKSNRLQCVERYNCPRFTEPNEHNDVILDYGIYILD